MSEELKPKRDRRSPNVALRNALRDAEQSGLSDLQMKLLAVRIGALNKIAQRKHDIRLRKSADAIKRLNEEVQRLTAENDNLKAELAQARAAIPARREPTEIERVLAAYEAEKRETGRTT